MPKARRPLRDSAPGTDLVAGNRTAGRATDARHRDEVRTFACFPSPLAWLRGVVHDRGSLISLGIVGVAMVGAVILAAARSALIPAKFSFDAHLIRDLARYPGHASAIDRSYSNAAAMYRLLGLQDAPVAVSVLTVLAFGGIVLLALMRRTDGLLPIPVAIIAGVVLLLGSVFLGTYSKDAPVLVVAAALLLLGRNALAEILVVALIVAYACLFRTYWLLILVGFLGLRVLWRAWPRRAVWIVGPLGVTIVLAVAVVVFVHHPADYFRSTVNIARSGDVDSHTMLREFITLPEPYGGTANVLATFFTLFVPVPLLGFAAPYYFAVFVLFVVVWSVFWWGLFRTTPLRGDPQGRFRGAAFLLALVSVQSLFEPDYGSVLRHLCPLLPVLLMVASGAPRASGASESGGRKVVLQGKKR